MAGRHLENGAALKSPTPMDAGGLYRHWGIGYSLPMTGWRGEGLLQSLHRGDTPTLQGRTAGCGPADSWLTALPSAR